MEQRELVCVSDCGHFGSALGFLSLRCLLSSCWIGGGVLRLFTFLSNLQTYAYLFSCFFHSLCAVKSEAILRLSLSSSLSPSLSLPLFLLLLLSLLAPKWPSVGIELPLPVTAT